MHFKKYVRFLALRSLYFTAFCLIISAGVLLPYMVLSSPAFCAVEPTVTPLPMVHVEEGLLAGFEEDDVIKFLGVPYAQPPVDDLRWKPPQPLLTWDGLKYAQKFAPSCPQPLLYNEPTSEDCLYLNIWTPSLDGSLPVMVWIHGGFFSRGSGSLSRFDGTTFAQTKRVLLITINYRLGAFGFLAHPALSSESALHTSGNYGLLDQVAALQWIQKNIRQFGGDPHNITIFG
ncbi:MAG: carboxylesterase family protein, partial [Aminobacterium sp.]